MSDPGSDSPPPPPPPGLVPPPGYASYAPNLSATLPLRRVGGLAKAILALLAISVVAAIIEIATAPIAVDAAKDFRAGTISADDFRSKLGLYGVTNLVASTVRLALVILSIIWLFRMIQNHRTIGRRVTWGPLWGVFGWLLPPFLYVIPTLVLAETWKASDDAVPPNDDRWKSGPVNPLVWVWFVVYGIAPLVLLVIDVKSQFGSFGGSTKDVADALHDDLGVLVLTGIVAALGAVSWALVVRAWTARHTRLTGEARSR